MNLHSLLRPPPLYLYMLGLFTLSALPGLAADGVLEIGQTCAVQTGCHAGDAPGFPVTIDQPGSFVLTSDLRVADANLDALQIQSDDVSIDLNGFTIVGPVDCTGLGSEVSCQPSGSGRGVDQEQGDRLAVREGRVRGFASDGIRTGSRSRVEGLVLEANGGSGLNLSTHSIARGVTVHRNALDGIKAGANAVVRESAASSNLDDGIDAGAGASVVGNASYDNGGDGIEVSSGSLVRDNSAYQNEDDGIETSIGCLASDNVAYGNGSDGIEAGADSAIQRNALRSNGGLGLNPLAADVAYRENVIDNNVGGSVSGGLDLGANACNGSLTCPP
jgi:hypothetical protein